MPAAKHHYLHPARSSKKGIPRTPRRQTRPKTKGVTMHPVSASERTKLSKFSKPALTLTVLAAITATLSACARNEAAQNPALSAPPQVTVAQVLSKPVTEFDDFTGRFEAIDRVEIRPRVSG